MPEPSESTVAPDAVSAVAPCDEEGASPDAPVVDAAGGETTEAVETEQERLERLLREKDEALRGQREQMLRMQADFENYKKRQQNGFEEEKLRAREGHHQQPPAAPGQL